MKSVFSVSEVNSYIAKLLKGDYLLTHLSVKGEVSNFKEHSNGKCYFSLKDSLASIRVILPVEVKERANLPMRDGMEVLLAGRLYVNERSGDFCVYAASVEETGVGKSYRDFDYLKKKLDNEGLFDPKHKKTLTCPCYNVGVITSPTGAAIHDIVSVIRRKVRSINIFLYPSLVQGDGAPEQLIAGIDFFHRHLVPDVILLGRGGGSYEDLSAFNDEDLARAIFRSSIPVVSAVGHQVDFTISDFVADVRAATPTHAAEIVVRTVEEFREALDEKTNRLDAFFQGKIRQLRTLLEERGSLLSKHDPIVKLRQNESRLQTKFSVLQSLWTRIVREKRIRLNECYRKLMEYEFVSPDVSVVDTDGKRIVSAREVSEGEVLKILFRDGEVSVRVLSGELSSDFEGEKGV